MNTKRNDQLARTNSPWSVALKVLCAIMAITGSAWPNQAGSIRPDFDTEPPAAPQTKRDPADKKRIKQLEREVRRKDKALAEATALVVLSKKLNAYFEEVEVGDMSEESDK